MRLTGNDGPSILVILMGSLGDLVRGLCLAHMLKRGRPRSRVTWLIEPQWQRLVENHPYIDRLLVFDRPRGVAAIPRIYRMLKQTHFDITLDLQRHFKSGFFSQIGRAHV